MNRASLVSLGKPASSRRVSTRTHAVIAPGSDRITLGNTKLNVSSIGVGAWSWGDRSNYWGYGKEYDKETNQACYKAVLDAGIDFIDTAEVYGFGLSEEFIRDFVQGTIAQGGKAPFIATKFAPQPWRLSADSVVDALKASTGRLGRAPDLYLQHWPAFLSLPGSNDRYLDGFVQARQMGLVENIGVSNFRPDRIRTWARRLKAEGIGFACNQVNYSLIYREPETNGVLETLREEGVSLMAYSPIAQGLLTGKYGPASQKVSGPRRLVFSDRTLERIQPLIAAMKAVGEENGGKSCTQVALNWLLCQENVFPIPGAKTPQQAADLKGAMGWRMDEGAVRELDTLSKKLLRDGQLFQGAPFEKW